MRFSDFIRCEQDLRQAHERAREEERLGLTDAEVNAQARELLAEVGDNPPNNPDTPLPNPDSTPWTPAPEGTPAEQHDRAMRYTDVQLLGKSFRVRRRIKEEGARARKGLRTVFAGTVNFAKLPIGATKRIAVNRAEKALKRKQDALEAAKAAKAGGRIMERRTKAVAEAAAKHKTKTEALDNHKTMRQRLDTINDKKEIRKQEIRDDFIKRREMALGRKALRKELRRQTATGSEISTYLLTADKTRIQQVGNVALIYETSRRMSAKSEKDWHKAVKSAGRTNRRLTKADARVRKEEGNVPQPNARLGNQIAYYDTERKWADAVADVSQAQLNEVTQRVNNLRTELSKLTPDDPQYLNVQLMLENARLQEADYTEHYNATYARQKEISFRNQREANRLGDRQDQDHLDRWRAQQERLRQAHERQGQLSTTLETRKQATRDASESARLAARTVAADQRALDYEVRAAIDNPDQKK